MTLSNPARLLLESLDTAQTVDRDKLPKIADLSQAIAIQDEIDAARQARGEVRCGYKIGFTNRTIWARYGVQDPIWGPVYQHTVQLLDAPQAQVDAALFCEPRLEPEIVVAFRDAPSDATPQAIAHKLAWVAHGFEIVQSPFKNWRFSGAEAFAAQGLHGALLVGPRVAPESLSPDLDQLPGVLAGLHVQLLRAGQQAPVDSGVGSNVLDGPLHAVAHLMRELAQVGRTLQAGDIITTGTITDAQPLANGQQWHTRLQHAVPLQNLTVDVGEVVTSGAR